MKVLVAGCGWLGREVARHLILRGDRVTALTRSEASASQLRESGIEAEAVDLATPSAWQARQGRYDGIVSAIAASGKDASAYRRAYIDATRGLLESDAAEGAAFVYVGSTGVFGQSDGSVVDEESMPQPIDETSEVLLEAERLVLEWSGSGVSSRIVRCTGLYGPGRLGTIERVRKGTLTLGDGDDVWMNFIHRDDAASVVIAALDRGRPGAIYHATDAHPARRRDVVAWIASRLNIVPARNTHGDTGKGRRATNRRVSAETSRRELGVRLAYPSFREGFAPFLG